MENNTIKNCMYEIERTNDSPMPIFKGSKVHEIKMIYMEHDLSENFIRMVRRSRGKNPPDDFKIGPHTKASNLNVKPPSIDKCCYCGILEYQLKRKLKTCGECKMVFYCSQECQGKNWKFHKPHCLSYIETKQKIIDGVILSQMEITDDENSEKEITVLDSPKWKRKNKK